MSKNYLDQIQENLVFKAKLEGELEDLTLKAMQSKNPNDLIKAASIFNNFNGNSINTGIGAKTVFENPLDTHGNLGYKHKRANMSYNLLRSMAQSPIINAIISTRVDQVASFSEPQPNMYALGFTIQRKGEVGKNGAAVDKKDEAVVKEITEFMLNCGEAESHWDDGDFEDFLRQTTWDSLTLDQETFEVVRNKAGRIIRFYATDGATMRYANHDKISDEELEKKKVDGYLPRYVQILENRVVAEFYPWELAFGVRNKSTDMRLNGYGTSELEVLINTVTALLNTDVYNSNFFTNGSAPKGILKFGEKVDRAQMHAFRQEWQAMLNGAENSWKVPMLSGETEWIDLQKTNTDMQFSEFKNYLIAVACSVFKLSPEEIGMSSDTSGSRPIFEGNSAETRLKFSKDKGLRPILRKKQRLLNRYIISQNWPEFEFRFNGLEESSEKTELELDEIRAKTFLTLDEVRMKQGYEPFHDPEIGGAIFNPNYVQLKSQEMMGDQQSDQFMADLLAEDGSISDTQTESGGSEAAANKSVTAFRKRFLSNS